MKKSIYILIILSLSSCHKLQFIKDLKDFPQNHTYYKKNINEAILTERFQNTLNSYFHEKFFYPWSNVRLNLKKLKIALKQQINYYIKLNGFAENKKRREITWYQQLRKNIFSPNMRLEYKDAIAIRHSNIRVFPTNKPLFKKINDSADGFPFDLFQMTVIWANTPIKILFTTRDQAWGYAITPYTYGWIKMNNIAWVNQEKKALWKNKDFAAVIKDNTKIIDQNGGFRFKARIGMILPIKEIKEKSIICYIFVADENNNAILKTISLSKNIIMKKPVKISKELVVKLANELIKEPYGWGGLFFNRDCSAMIKDFFVPFGIWLPRNSTQQAKSSFYIDLQNLKPKYREKMILKNGIPYFTLVWIKGHIMLYIGPSPGPNKKRAMVFHNTWGIRTINGTSTGGRKIIGKAVITTLEPGINIEDFDHKKGKILNKVLGMTILIPPGSFQELF